VSELPAGTVTLLFSDIEGSTRLVDDLGAAYADVLGDHRRVIRETIAGHGGVEVGTEGDSFFVVFGRTGDAVAATADAQRTLAVTPVRVRMGLHTGEPALTHEGYVGIDVHRAARIAAAAHGGQVVLSEATRALYDGPLELRDLGEHRLKDLTEPIHLFQLGRHEFPPLRSLSQARLPAELEPLVGRKRELGDLVRLLAREGARVVTITGRAGWGRRGSRSPPRRSSSSPSSGARRSWSSPRSGTRSSCCRPWPQRSAWRATSSRSTATSSGSSSSTTSSR